jgi:phospholipid/cholesterol/gamma-HCH transport system permease protein
MKLLARIGRRVIHSFRGIARATSIYTGALRLALLPRCWTRPVREQLGRQILFTGIEGIPIISLFGALAGLMLVAHGNLWLRRFGQTDLFGPLVLGLLVRGLAPLAAVLIVISRSGTAIVTEMATLRNHRQVLFLDALGLDPMIMLVMPRIIGVSISVFLLAVVMTVVAVVVGVGCAPLMGSEGDTARRLLVRLLEAVSVADVPMLLLKTLLPGGITATICCTQGLDISGTVTEIPQAATRAVVRSMGWSAIVVALITVVAGVLSNG